MTHSGYISEPLFYSDSFASFLYYYYTLIMSVTLALHVSKGKLYSVHVRTELYSSWS